MEINLTPSSRGFLVEIIDEIDGGIERAEFSGYNDLENAEAFADAKRTLRGPRSSRMSVRESGSPQSAIDRCQPASLAS